VLLWIVSVPNAFALCEPVLKPYWVSVEWDDGSTGGHWQYEWVMVCYGGGGGGGGSGGGDGGSTGGGGGPLSPQQELADQYANVTCSDRTNPTAADFVNSTAFQQRGTWSFSDLKDPNYSYALIKDELQYGLVATQDNCGGCAINLTSGYRAPATNGGTSGSGDCSGHLFGTAVDISIRDSTGQHSCAVWNQIAVAAGAAGAWVEPVDELVQRNGVVHHVHIDFGRPSNDQAFGVCTADMLP
jgi:hypothetical protein